MRGSLWLYGKTIAPRKKKTRYPASARNKADARTRSTVIFIPFDWNNSGVDWRTRLCFQRPSFDVPTYVRTYVQALRFGKFATAKYLTAFSFDSPSLVDISRAGGCGCIFIAARTCYAPPTGREARNATSVNACFNYSVPSARRFISSLENRCRVKYRRERALLISTISRVCRSSIVVNRVLESAKPNDRRWRCISGR